MADSRRSYTCPAEDEDDADVKEGDPLEHYAKRVGWLHFSTEDFQRANAVTAISAFAQWAKVMDSKAIRK